MKKSIYDIGDLFLDLLYPRCCPLCNQVRPYQGETVCKSCLQMLKRVQGPRCLKCGKHVEDEEQALCGDCQTRPKSFVRGFPAFEYADPLKRTLYDFKYKNQRAYASFLAAGMMACVGDDLKGLKVEAMLPVPVHPRKKKRRGYNQAQLLAKALEPRIQVPVMNGVLVRNIDTNPQKELNEKQRLSNLKNAFKITGNAIKLKKVLLVDDIYTSGATIECCTQVLLAAGVEEVYYTSVAIGKGY